MTTQELPVQSRFEVKAFDRATDNDRVGFVGRTKSTTPAKQ
jgi:hypothetical protein